MGTERSSLYIHLAWSFIRKKALHCLVQLTNPKVRLFCSQLGFFKSQTSMKQLPNVCGIPMCKEVNY